MVQYELVVALKVLAEVSLSEFDKAVAKAGYTREEVLEIIQQYAEVIQ
jgi:hypothetical protein